MTIGVDFDGVIHRYSKGWNGGGVYDPPMPGALEALEELMRESPVFIFTARDPQQVKDALRKWGVENVIAEKTASRKFWNQRDILLVTNHKYAAKAYIDDRAVRFENWEQALEAVGLREPSENYRTEPENRVAAAVRALHAPVGFVGSDRPICDHCTDLMGRNLLQPTYWPCETVKLLDAVPALS